MNSRERVIKTINHQEPDRVPLDIGGGTSTTIVIEAYDKLKEYLGIKEKTEIMSKTFRLAKISETMIKELGSDCYPLGIKGSKKLKSKEVDSGSYIDAWGVEWKKVLNSDGSCYYYDVVKSPLLNADIRDLDKYPWPDPHDPDFTKGLLKDAEKLSKTTDYALIGDSGFKSFWELAYMLRGYEQLLTDLVLNKKFVHKLLSILLELNLIITERFLNNVGQLIQVFRTADDLATQNGLIMSLDTYRKQIKPFYKKYYESIRSRTDAKIFYHSCGNITDILDDLVEIGVEIINPVQVSAIKDIKNLKKRYSDRLTFWGGIDTQRVLPFGTAQDVRMEVCNRIKELGKMGGYVVASVHNIQADVPPENILAMTEATHNFGRY